MRTSEGHEMTATGTTASTETRCLRCGRRLRHGGTYGPKCAAKIRQAAIEEARAGYTADQQAKADELIRDGGLVPHPHKGVFTAVSSKGDATYLVHRAACNCPAGIKSRRCYHRLAAAILGVTARPARSRQRLAA